MAKNLALAERGDSFICQLAALVHDLVDDKLVADEGLALTEVRDLLTRLGVRSDQTDQVLAIIQAISYKGGSQNHLDLTLEGQIVQDADRLDAMGAIGVARTMAYSGYHGRVIHDPEVAVRQNMTLGRIPVSSRHCHYPFLRKVAPPKGLDEYQDSPRAGQEAACIYGSLPGAVLCRMGWSALGCLYKENEKCSYLAFF